MNKFRFLFWISCVSATVLYAGSSSAEKTHNIPQESLHVYLLLGQSNMSGRAPYTEQEAGVIDRCYLLNGNDQWEPARNPLNRYSSIGKALRMQKLNPGYSFSKAMLAQDPDLAIGLVVNARGGTAIAEWAKGTEFYNEALRRAKAAQKTGTLKGILWHQGEGDSHSGRTEKYLEALTTLIADLRHDLAEPDLPFVAGQVYYHPRKRPGTKRINEQIALLPSKVPFTGYADSKGLTAFDIAHFDTESMKKLGKRYAEEMLRAREKKIHRIGRLGARPARREN